MSVYIKQGVNEDIELEMPFNVSLLSDFTVDIFQSGAKVLSKAYADCTIVGNTISTTLTQHDTLKLSPQRALLMFRGLYADGGTVVIEDIPCVVCRSSYREAAE